MPTTEDVPVSEAGHPPAAGVIARAGLVAGVLDITAACLHAGARGIGPARVLRYVASGLLGPSALQGGAGTAAVGLLAHFVIATGAAAVYYLASRRLEVLVRQAVVCGLAYGVVVYFVMSRVVVPLSAVPARAPVVDPVMIVIHMLCVGLPIALVVRRFSRPRG